MRLPRSLRAALMRTPTMPSENPECQINSSIKAFTYPIKNKSIDQAIIRARRARTIHRNQALRLIGLEHTRDL